MPEMFHDNVLEQVRAKLAAERQDNERLRSALAECEGDKQTLVRVQRTLVQTSEEEIERLRADLDGYKGLVVEQEKDAQRLQASNRALLAELARHKSTNV